MERVETPEEKRRHTVNRCFVWVLLGLGASLVGASIISGIVLNSPSASASESESASTDSKSDTLTINEPSPTLEAGALTSSNCGGPKNDVAWGKLSTPEKFDAAMSSGGIKCFSKCGTKGSECRACLTGAEPKFEGFASPCVDCFGELVICSARKCAMPCMCRLSKSCLPGGDCERCVQTNCNGNFETCSGRVVPKVSDMPKTEPPTRPPTLKATDKPTVSPTTVASSANKCVSDSANDAAWAPLTERGNFISAVASEGFKCWSKCPNQNKECEACVTSKAEQLQGFTAPCFDCFRELIHCSAAKCYINCTCRFTGTCGVGDKCDDCMDAKCNNQFEVCSGHTLSQSWNSTTAKTVAITAAPTLSPTNTPTTTTTVTVAPANQFDCTQCTPWVDTLDTSQVISKCMSGANDGCCSYIDEMLLPSCGNILLNSIPKFYGSVVNSVMKACKITLPETQCP